MPVFDIPMVTRGSRTRGQTFSVCLRRRRDAHDRRWARRAMPRRNQHDRHPLPPQPWTRRVTATWRDNDLAQHQAMLDDDFALLISWVEAGGPVFLPKAGLGMLQPRVVDTAPRTFLFSPKEGEGVARGPPLSRGASTLTSSRVSTRASSARSLGTCRCPNPSLQRSWRPAGAPRR